MPQSNLEVAEELLNEATLLDFKKKLGGNEAAGNSNLKVGERYVQRISLIREIDIELAHFKAMIDGATKMQPVDQIAVRELKRALKAMETARASLAKSIKEFRVVMPDRSIK
jgi:hypothetical protein